jgi:2-aminoadipate transaminase
VNSEVYLPAVDRGAGITSPGSAGTRLDPHLGRYARRTLGMSSSEIRALFAVASRPEVVSLAGGMPYVSALPFDAVGAAISRLVIDRGATALQYGSGQGMPELREQICDIAALEGIAAHPDSVVVTTGSQQALDIVTRVLVDPGDVVLVEAPSYVGALGVFRCYEAEVVHLPMDAEGLIPDQLERTIQQLQRAGRRVKFLYTIPNFHNPAGICLSSDRRSAVLDICRKADLLILEDNPYGLLGFDGVTRPALRAEESESVLYLGSFSKTFAPGCRVGWVIAPHAIREKLILASEAAILCPSSFSQLVVSTYLQTQPWRQQIRVFQDLYRKRRDALLESLDALFPTGTQWTQPAGGFYVWVTLPEPLNSSTMLPRAITAGVAYVPGTAFFANGDGHRSLRLSYCYPEPERIREGARRLAAVVHDEIDLSSVFGGTGSAKSAPRRASRQRHAVDAPSPDLS